MKLETGRWNCSKVGYKGGMVSLVSRNRSIAPFVKVRGQHIHTSNNRGLFTLQGRDVIQ